MESTSLALFVFLVASSVLCAGQSAHGSAGNELGQEKSYCSGSSPPTYPTTPSIPSYGPPDGLVPPSIPSYGPPDSLVPPSIPSYGPPDGLVPPSIPSYGPPDGLVPSSPPGGGYYGTPAVPSTPDISTPSTPDISTPSTPAISTPSPPDDSTPSFGFPGTGPGSCSFWNDHPEALPSILSFFSSISSLFGGGASSVFGPSMTLKEALSNKRGDGYGSLLREGAAALLNSLVNKDFYYSTSEVKNKFNAALVSNHSAEVQAVEFQNANEGPVHR